VRAAPLKLAVTLLIGLAALVWSQPTLADKTAALGAANGPSFNLRCNDGDALIGLNYSAGKALGRIVAICNSVGKKKTDGAQYDAGSAGTFAAGQGGGALGTHFAEGGPLVCPNRLVIRKFHVFLDDFNAVYRVAAACSEAYGGGSDGSFATGTQGGQSTHGDDIECPPGEVATGVFGHASNIVYQMGLRCGHLADDPTHPPLKVVDTKHPTPAPLTGAGSFAGIWTTHTSLNGHFTVTLTPIRHGDQASVTGSFIDSSNPKFNGTLTGTLGSDGRMLIFTWTQPKNHASGTGMFFMNDGGAGWAGGFKVDGDAKSYGWFGTRG
jgi:hypothetical protein